MGVPWSLLDVRSISRCHATIRYQKGADAQILQFKLLLCEDHLKIVRWFWGSFVLEDHNSKFGGTPKVMVVDILQSTFVQQALPEIWHVGVFLSTFLFRYSCCHEEAPPPWPWQCSFNSSWALALGRPRHQPQPHYIWFMGHRSELSG